MKNTFTICCLVFVFGIYVSIAQDSLLVPQQKVDSLKMLIHQHSKDDEEKVRLFYKFNKPDSAFCYGHNALLLVRKIKFP